MNPGHQVEVRQASGGNQLLSVTEADSLFAGTIPTVFVANDNGIGVINYTDLATTSSPGSQQLENFGGDRDIRAIPGNGFTTGGQNEYAIRSSGFIFIPQAGAWNFTVNSDDGFRLRMYNNGSPVVITQAGLQAPNNNTGVADVPAPGLYRYDLTYFEHNGGSEEEFFANGPGQPSNALVGDPAGTLRVFQAVAQTGAITVTGDGNGNTLVVTATTVNSGTYQLDNGPITPLVGATSFTFNGLGGNDTFRVNNPGGGLFAPANGISYDGGTQAGVPGDRLEILGGSHASATYTFAPDGANGHNGSLALVNGATAATYTYTGPEPVLVNADTPPPSFSTCLRATGTTTPSSRTTPVLWIARRRSGARAAPSRRPSSSTPPGR